MGNSNGEGGKNRVDADLRQENFFLEKAGNWKTIKKILGKNDKNQNKFSRIVKSWIYNAIYSWNGLS